MSQAFCPICYEAVDILLQNLESVVGCGHVFHESCLHKWVRHSPLSPKCPLCKTSCGDRERQRLYFQSSAESSQQQAPSSTEIDLNNIEKDKTYVCMLEAKERRLRESLEMANKQISLLVAAEEDYKLKIRSLSEITRIANQRQSMTEESLTNAQKELADRRRGIVSLLNKLSALERDLTTNKLRDQVDLSEDEVISLVSSCHQSKDEYIQMLAKSLVSRNRSFKDLMTTCNELGIEASKYRTDNSKLKAKLEHTQTRLKEITNAQERSDNATLRSLKDGDTRSKSIPVKVGVNSSIIEEVCQHICDISPELQRECVEMDLPELPRKSTLELFPPPAGVRKTLASSQQSKNRIAPENISVDRNLSSTRRPDMYVEDLVGLDLGSLPIPIRKERNSSLVEESYAPRNGLLGLQETGQNLSAFTKFPKTALFGTSGRGGRGCVRPPPSFILPPSQKGNSFNRPAKRPKVATPQGSKIDDFFGRN